MPAATKRLLLFSMAAGFAIEIPLFLAFAYEWRFPALVAAALRLVHMPATLPTGVLVWIFGKYFPSIDYPATYTTQSCINGYVLFCAARAWSRRKHGFQEQMAESLK
jgi:hypothetical protein